MATGRILAIDYGRRRLGLAISDELRVTSRPLITLARTNRRDDLRRLRLLAREHRVRCIVVGLPLHLDGAASEMAAEATRFAARLAQHLCLPVEMADERLTSWEAAEHAPSTARIHGKQHKPARTAARDDVAAAIILRDYLATRPHTRKRAPTGRAKN
jgi:putative Holliday junction resolvase